MLVERLTKRVTHTILQRHLDRLHQPMGVAEGLGYTGKTRLLTDAALAQVTMFRLLEPLRLSGGR